MSNEIAVDLAWRRWTLILATLFFLAVLQSSRVWTVALAMPLLLGGVAVHLFAAEALARWISRGTLLLADLLFLGLALCAVDHPRALAFVALFGVALIAALSAERVRTILASVPWIGAVAALGAAGLAPGLELSVADLAYVPMLLVAAVHFGLLAENVPRRPAAAAPSREHDEVWALLDIADTVTSTLDVEEVMHSVVERVGGLVGTPSCSILIADNRSPDCYVMASKGHPEARMLGLDLTKYPEIRKALSSRREVVVDDVATDPLVAGVRDVLLAQGYRSLLVLPLLFGKEVLGALFLKSHEPQAFPESALRFCKVAACVSANALKNAMLYRDVTEEAARHRETSEKLRRVLDGTPDMIVATDAEGRVVEFNQGACALTGWSTTRAAGRTVAEILGAEDLAAGPPPGQSLDVEFRRADGETLAVSLVSAPLRGADGEPSGRVWIGRDVTQLRRVERSLAQAERLSALGEVVAGVAHELNNPLSGVVGYAELLRANANDPGQIRDLQRIVESAMRCQKIVLKLLSFARRHPPEKRFQNLNDCVRKVLDLKSYHLRSAQIETALELDPQLPGTCFDFHQIDQVILNLLNNAEQAITAVSRSGRIVLRTGVDDGFVFLEVADDGPGVAEAVAERIFDPFFTTKELGKGTGLGLSVSYGIVQEHGGRIQLRPYRPGTGACFRISLPVVEGEPPPVPSSTETERPATPLQGRRILVAEDEPMVLELFSRLLSQEGAAITLAHDGQEAWERLAEGEFDLVVADLRMPNVSGQQLYERVAEERPELLRRFVFATGDLVRQETLAFLEGLPNRILTKPLELETVRRVLSQALDAAGG